jgi:PKD repeat protein|tara:strand:+ start:66439 stop:68496 length:2058 start_codon:yes stop_codon:yes gene_type:complete
MKKIISIIILTLILFQGFSQQTDVYQPCLFDETSNNKKSLLETEQKIQAAIQKKFTESFNKASSHGIYIIPVVVHIIHDGGTENISEAQVQSQIQILNEDFGKLPGTNGDGNGVDTEVRFCLAKKDPNGNCTNGIVRIKSSFTNHQTYQRGLLKELSFWDNTRYLNIYVVKSINGNVAGYSSFPGGPPDEDGVVVRHVYFGNTGTASSSLGRTTTHELGHWFGLYHTFNNGCGIDTCTDGDYVCDTPPQASPSFNCNTLNTCSNDIPDLNDLKENYMNYTPDACKDMFTAGQKQRIQATLDTIRTQIWTTSNLIATGCDSNYIAPTNCQAIADFVTLTPNICVGNNVYFMDRSLNNPFNWQWSFPGGTPSVSTSQNPTVTYSSTGTYAVKLVVTDSTGSDSLEVVGYITVSQPGIGNSLSYSEDFDLGIYPPSSLTIVNYDGGVTWELDSFASVSGNYSIKINNLINTNYGSSDELVLPYFDLTSSDPDSNVYMSFKWAYAKSDPTFSDELLVLLSTDCGVNFTQVFYRTQTALVTGPTQTTPFIPDSTQWKNAYISLNNYRTSTYVQLKIVNVTDGGNNLYIDNIYVGDNITGITNVQETEFEAGFSVYPNPSSGQITIKFPEKQDGNVRITITDISGRVLKNELTSVDNTYQKTYSLTNFSNGIYFISVETKGIGRTQKIILN